VHRAVDASVQQVVTVTAPRSIFPTEPRHSLPTCAVAVPDSRSPESSTTSTPSPCGAVAGFASSNSRRHVLTYSLSQIDSDTKN
jgi:hypothetical protein